MKSLIWPVCVVCGVIWITLASSQAVSTISTTVPVSLPAESSSADAVTAINRELEKLRGDAELKASQPADELTVWRRLSLALHGTIPSLEEIRRFEADVEPGRLERQLEIMFNDERFADYFSERLARSYVGVDNGQFLIFRRDRFLEWISGQVRENRPYDEIVRQMITGTGVWTGKGEVNFITSAYADDQLDPNKLTARTVRAFLGQRMDCAQCHDHPFDHWKQSDFEGLTAYYGRVKRSLYGVIDSRDMEYTVPDPMTEEDCIVAPAVPFHPEWLGDQGGRRHQLARWVTHPENKRFERAAANRIWALMFGRPYLTDRPVDDLPDPEADSQSKVLDILGEDFRLHGYDLRHLIRTIMQTDAFQMSSISANENSDEMSYQDDLLERTWSSFPLVRLRPEQVIGSMLQANNVRTIDQNSHLFVRAMRFFRERDFVDEFGDPGVEELQDWSGTIPQALLRMNGKLARELTNVNPFSAPGRISATGSSPANKVEAIFLACLTRRPTETELNYFVEQFESEASGVVIEDLYWILFNAPEFSWNH